MPEEKNPKRTIVVGDVHGQFDPFVKILRHARLVDQDLNWSGESHRLVQMGDILDRGPFSRKVDDLLDKIQQQAASAQGEVIRLIGNHELELLLSNFVISGFSKDKPEGDLYEGVDDINFDFAGEIAGSKIMLANACRNMMCHTGSSLCQVFKYASTNPAKVLSLSDRGEIAIGKRADLIMIDDLFSVKHVFLGGEQIN